MQMHKEGQSASTCGQCGKVFNREDNMLKHLHHCTGYRPPQLHQQPQQHTTASPPPPFTISQRYISMGGAVKRYNMDMQETQHLDNLSAAILLLLPTTNEDIPRQTPCIQVSGCHHDCVSESGGPTCCHTTTSYHNLGNDCCICSRCYTTTRRRQPTATEFHRGVPIERIGVGILPLPRPPVGIMAARPFTR